MNLLQTITPKSDQLNADDLIGGILTIKITGVKEGSAEQPVIINYEGDKGRPYKPGKSMRRVLVSAWGADGNSYIGRRLTLFRDPEIRFGSDVTGGIRISHMSDIPREMQIVLTVTRGKRKPFFVNVLAAESATPTFDLQSLSDIGDTKAGEGKSSLEAWWVSLTKPERVALKDKIGTWKERAV